MNYPIDVDTYSYVDVVGQLAGANRAVIDAVSTLTDVLYASGAMAGSDTGGAEWAGQYDPAAKELVQAGCSMGDALANMATLLEGSAQNHAAGDRGAMMDPSGADPGVPNDSSHGTEGLYAPPPPSAAGGTGDLPGWWHWIASHVEGLLWPDANTGQLRSAGQAWITAGTTISNQQYAVDAANTGLYEITSPEMDDVHASCTKISGFLGDLGAAYLAVGKACNDYAGYVDQKHQEVEDELTSFLEWTVAIEVAGGALAFFTVGISEAAAQAAEAGEIANAATKVIRILNELIELARTVKTAIETALQAIVRLPLELAKFVNAKLVAAFTKAAEEVVTLTPEEMAALEEGTGMSAEQLAAIERYTGWQYAQLNRYLRGLDLSDLGGLMSPEELEALAKDLSGGLDRLPTFSGTTFRGTNLSEAQLDALMPGGSFSDPAFLSSSTDAAQAAKFRDNVMFKIEGSSGHDVDALSTMKGEKEILFDKGTKFDVVSKTWNPDGYWDVTLKEK